MSRNYLSISFCYHDSSITISSSNQILLHVEAERFFHKKHYRFKDLDDVNKIVEYALNELGMTIDNIHKLYITNWNNLFGEEVKVLGKKFDPIYTSHHNNHIGTAFPSDFRKCVILCSDGGSEDGYTKLYYKKGNKIKLVEDLDNREFTGKFYGTIAQMLIEPKGSKAHTSGVGKLMGLSALGKYDKNIERLIIENIDEINTLHFDNVNNLLKKFNLDGNYNDVWKSEYKKNIATTAHIFWVNKCKEYLKQHNKYSRNICLVGGCALNITLNSTLLEEKIYDRVYVSPISTDSGQALGAILYDNPKIKCKYPYLGVGKESNYLYDKEEIINDLLSGKVIAWYQGRSEIGARALGHRSFIGIPTKEEYRKRISEEIKNREPYRPVAGIIPYEEVSNYFEQNYNSPYMTFCSKAKSITKKMAPAIVHGDGTTRIQTITKEDNPIIYDILMILKEKIGVPIIMNTSLNVMGDPIADTIEDAILTYEKSKADELYINGTKYIERKLITVLIATYNNQDCLSETLKSFEENNLFNDNNIEVIIVENCKDKKAFDKTKKFEKKYKLKVYHEKRQGKSFALNLGIIKSNGKYIYSTDDDVMIENKKWLYDFVSEFEKNNKLGYVSGKVSMYKESSNQYSELWERKGGLSKGENIKYWSLDYINSNKFKIKPWPLHKICAGANQMIRKDILLEVGGYAEFLGRNDTVDGLTLEIGYKIAKHGYEILYNPNLEIYHKHPVSEKEIKKKLYYYGIQDTGVSMYIYLTNKDFRYLWWSLFGHSCYTIKKMILSLFNKYPLKIKYLKYGLKGNLKGGILCLKAYRKNKKYGNNI